MQLRISCITEERTFARCVAHHIVAETKRSYDIFQVGPQPKAMRMLYDEAVIALLLLTIAIPHMRKKCRVACTEKVR